MVEWDRDSQLSRIQARQFVIGMQERHSQDSSSPQTNTDLEKYLTVLRCGRPVFDHVMDLPPRHDERSVAQQFVREKAPTDGEGRTAGRSTRRPGAQSDGALAERVQTTFANSR